MIKYEKISHVLGKLSIARVSFNIVSDIIELYKRTYHKKKLFLCLEFAVVLVEVSPNDKIYHKLSCLSLPLSMKCS